MQLYELAIHISPQLDEEEVDKVVKDLSSLIKKAKGEVKEELYREKINLAYPLRKPGEGLITSSYFLSLLINFPAEELEKFRDNLRHNKDILRFALFSKEEVKAPVKKTSTRKQSALKKTTSSASVKKKTAEDKEAKKEEKKEPSKKPKKVKKLKIEDIDKSLEKLLDQEL